MKRKSPKNYRLKTRAAARRHSEPTFFFDSDAQLYYNGSAATTTVTFPTSSFSGSGFQAGDIISVSGATEPKRSKKVHVARRRIPKRSNNGEWMITSTDSSSSICVTDLNNLVTTGNWTFSANICVV